MLAEQRAEAGNVRTDHAAGEPARQEIEVVLIGGPLMGVHLMMIRGGSVSALKEPAAIGANGDPTMPAGVTGERDQVDLGTDYRANPDGLKAKPVAVHGLVKDPSRGMGPVPPVTAAFDDATGLVCSLILDPMDVNGRLGKIPQPAGVVEVEVGQDDMAQITGRVAESLDLAQGGLVLIARGAHQAEEEAHKRGGIGIVQAAKAGVHQGEPLVGLDEQAVDDALHPGKARPQGAAVEVMNDRHPGNSSLAEDQCSK